MEIQIAKTAERPEFDGTGALMLDFAYPQKTIGVQLGRFAPYHKGHQQVTYEMMLRHDPNDCLIMVGSSNVLNERTPFTFEQRRKMIQRVIPNIPVIPIPDVDPNRLVHSETTVPKWLKQIKKLQEEMRVKFKFYGGSSEDLRFFEEDFETEVVVPRETEGEDISGTKIRQLLHEDNLGELTKVMNSKVIPLAVHYFHENFKKFIAS